MAENKPFEFIFIFVDSPSEARGWWLKLTSMDGLLEYTRLTSGARLTPGFELYWELAKKAAEKDPKLSVLEYISDMPTEERFRLMHDDMHAWNTMYAAIQSASNAGNATILDGFRMFNMDCGQSYLRHLREDGVVFINRNGGCNSFLSYTHWCRQKGLVWPDFRESDIRLKQFPGGKHWYAYIGDMEVQNGDTLRFNTYGAARQAALDIIRNA